MLRKYTIIFSVESTDLMEINLSSLHVAQKLQSKYAQVLVLAKPNPHCKEKLPFLKVKRVLARFVWYIRLNQKKRKHTITFCS